MSGIHRVVNKDGHLMFMKQALIFPVPGMCRALVSGQRFRRYCCNHQGRKYFVP